MCTAPNQYGNTHNTELCNINHHSGHVLKTEHYFQLRLSAHKIKSALCILYIQSVQLFNGDLCTVPHYSGHTLKKENCAITNQGGHTLNTERCTVTHQSESILYTEQCTLKY